MHRPDPEMRSPATGQGDRANSQNNEKSKSHSTKTRFDFQAGKARWLLSVCNAAARTIAALAFAAGPR
jgi:hypothetical protein